MEKRLKAIEELKMEQEESIMIKKDMDRKLFLALECLKCEDYAICFLLSTRMASHNYMASAKSVSLYCISSGVSQSAIAALFCKINFGQKQFSTCCFGLTQPCFIDKFRRMTWSVRSSLNDSNFSLSTSNVQFSLGKANTTIYCQRIQEAITRQQAVPTPLLYRNPVLSLSSGHKVYRKSMATSPSKAVLGDVYDDDLVSSCSNGVDFTKPARVVLLLSNLSRGAEARRRQGPHDKHNSEDGGGLEEPAVEQTKSRKTPAQGRSCNWWVGDFEHDDQMKMTVPERAWE
ncbi:uncharacterized protein DS421_20g700150 [Arachis hypogaea]|nr:uncharacterized protein DS421_20g700150 [Arachis hypogaea]